jgi:glycosyltransferase involved in cell wall biosynthesis
MNISIVSHNAFGAIAGGAGGHVGGVERQTTMMARWLAKRGHQVSLLTWHEGQDGEKVIDGVRIIKMCARDAGIAGLRFFIPRWSSLVYALREADAQLYYHNCAEYVTGQIAFWCRRNKRAFVYSVASDPECDPDLPALDSWREKVLFRYGLKQADKIIVQTKTQQQMLTDGFDLKSTVLPMPCVDYGEHLFDAVAGSEATTPAVGWVGRINQVKRLEFLLDVAESCPDIQFKIAGKPDHDNAYSRDVQSRAEKIPNVALLGMVARKDMPDFYRGISCLCCTSHFEGFPNTFLEAWSFGIPVISTVNSGNLLTEHELGVFAEDVEGFAEAVHTCLDDRVWMKKTSQKCRNYFMENHSEDAAMQRFEELFHQVVKNKY